MQTTSRWSKNSIRFIHIPTGECQDIYCCPFRVKTTFHQMHVSWNSWLTLSIFVALLYSPRTNLTYLDDTNLTALTTLLTTRQRVSIRPRCMQSLYWMIPIFVYFFRFFPPSPLLFSSELALIEVSATRIRRGFAQSWTNLCQKYILCRNDIERYRISKRTKRLVS